MSAVDIGAGTERAWGHPGIRAAVALGIVYLGSAAVCCAYAATSRANFVDLHVYRMGAAAARHGIDVYEPRYYWLPFTYPPFAALAFIPGTVLPVSLAAAVLTAGSVLALPIGLYLALRLPSPVTRLSPGQALAVALAAAAVAIWLEPVRTALAYGQLDLWLDLAVLLDLALDDGSRWKGTAIGVAAGIKLTPAIFALYLLATRRYRAAATAAAAFAATVITGFLVLPASSARYWGGMFLNPGHVGQVQDAENQSLLGAMSRTLGTANPTLGWLFVAAPIAAAGLALAARAQRRGTGSASASSAGSVSASGRGAGSVSASGHGDEATGFALCAITGLLVSPISWSHHWALAIPALVLAVVAIYRGRDRRPLALTVLGAAAVAGLAAAGWARLARSVPSSGWLHLDTKALLYSEIYVLAGLAVIALAAGGAALAWASGRGATLAWASGRGAGFAWARGRGAIITRR